MDEQKFNIKPHLIAGAISLGIGAIVFCLFFFLKKMTLIAALDGTGYTGIILIGIACLIFCGREGFFDIFSYGFKQLGASMFAKNPTKYNDFPGYKEQVNSVRKTRSKYYLTILFIGLAFLIAAIILFIIYKTM